MYFWILTLAFPGEQRNGVAHIGGAERYEVAGSGRVKACTSKSKMGQEEVPTRRVAELNGTWPGFFCHDMAVIRFELVAWALVSFPAPPTSP